MPSTITRTDTDNTRAWDTLVIELDDLGSVLSRTFTNDDGSTRALEYRADGSLSSRVRTDTDPSTNDWESIRQEYRSSGVISSTRIEYDNGIVLSESYASGNGDMPAGSVFYRSMSDDFDADGSFANKSWRFDADGNVTDYFILYDNDTTLSVSNSPDGSTQLRERTDAFESDGFFGDANSFESEGLYDWTTRSVLIDVDTGERLEVFTVFDSGLVVERGLTENSGLTFVSKFDGVPIGPVFVGPLSGAFEEPTKDDLGPSTSDAFVWNQSLRVLDEAGDVQGRLVQMDNDDVILTIFDEGDREGRINFNYIEEEDEFGVQVILYDVGEGGDMPSPIPVGGPLPVGSDVVLYFDSVAELLLSEVDLTPFLNAFDFDSVTDLFQYLGAEPVIGIDIVG